MAGHDPDHKNHEKNGLSLHTSGLKASNGHELRASVSRPRLLAGCEDFLCYAIERIPAKHRHIEPDDPIRYGYWAMCGVVATDGYLDFHEPVPGCPTFGLEEQPGVDACVTYREEQHAICRNIQAAFSLPEPGQLIMVSDGVYEGDLVQGVRSHMSGWWITTNRYDDDITSLRTVHACHVTAARPDLARYLAVPFGWRFDTAQGRIYVDPEAGIAENGSQGPACSKPWQRDMGREKACQYDQCYKKHHHAPNNKDMSFFCRGG